MTFDVANALGARPESVAKDVLDRLWDRTLPVDPVRIAKAAGAVVYGRGGPGDEYYDFSGYFREFNGRPSIEYNVTEPSVRQRFTIAHELGHFVLGHSNLPRDRGDFPSSADPQERLANRFAAELLMPAEAVRQFFLSGAASSTEELAQLFDVSKAAMGYRLINLGLV